MCVCPPIPSLAICLSLCLLLSLYVSSYLNLVWNTHTHARTRTHTVAAGACRSLNGTEGVNGLAEGSGERGKREEKRSKARQIPCSDFRFSQTELCSRSSFCISNRILTNACTSQLARECMCLCVCARAVCVSCLSHSFGFGIAGFCCCCCCLPIK